MIKTKLKKLLLIFIIAIFLIGCKLITKKESSKKLTELQIEACNTANEAASCDTRLVEVGIVLKEECCKALGKCC